jgi:hypothetical protein
MTIIKEWKKKNFSGDLQLWNPIYFFEWGIEFAIFTKERDNFSLKILNINFGFGSLGLEYEG